jgi:hypothetical protein
MNSTYDNSPEPIGCQPDNATDVAKGLALCPAVTPNSANPAHPHDAPPPSDATPIADHSRKPRGGAPRGNQNALTKATRSRQHPPWGSKLHKDFAYAGTLANRRVRAVTAELLDRQGGNPLTAAQEVQLRQIWLAEAADRVAGMMLGNGRNFKDKPLTVAEQNEQRAIQAKAQQSIENALNKLGIGLESSTNTKPTNAVSDWAAMLAAVRNTPNPEPTL